MFELGEFLKTRYNKFLPQQLSLKSIHAQSTDMNRSKMSLQLVLAGLFPPKNTTLEWNKNLNWQPIPFTYEPLFSDNLLLVTKPCPRYHEELERVLKEDVKTELDQYTNMFEQLSNYTGWKVKTPLYVQHLHGIFKSQEEFGLELPKWVKSYYPHDLHDFVMKANIYNAYNSQLKKLKGGVFLKKVINDWELKISGNLDKKIFIYSGHDQSGESFKSSLKITSNQITSLVTNILSAFNAWELPYPNYGITVMLEFSQHEKTKEYGLEVGIKCFALYCYNLISLSFRYFCVTQLIRILTSLKLRDVKNFAVLIS